MDLERDFAAWAGRRDADALARVFDATAGKLLLLAAHVAPRGTAPEDLVQATFLAAMARGAGFDARRPLWPWLATILHNEANMARRQQARRREVDLAHADGAHAGDPAQVAASEEAFAAVLAAIDALPLPYRQVLRLRLVHGLEPIEIARALEVPVGTVRSQLHRGLARLRAALPAGVAAALGALLLGDGALLAQVKTQVLARAASLGTAAAGATAAAVLATGGTAMLGKKVTLAVGLAALLLLLGAVFGVPPRFGVAPVREPAQPVAAQVRGDAAATDGHAADEARRTAAAEAPRAPAWPLVVTVRGADARPIDGAQVRVWVAPAPLMIANRPQGEYRQEDVASGVTGADGTFRCDLDAFRTRSALFRGTSYVFVSASSPSGSSSQRVVGFPRELAPRAVEAAIDLRPSRGVAGRVVDAAGRPVAGAQFAVLHDKEHSPSSACHERSAADGRFRVAIDDHEEAGWNTGVLAMHPSLGVAAARIPAAAGEHAGPAGERDVGTLVLDARAAIRGQVVLGDGSPLGDCALVVAKVDPALVHDEQALRTWLVRSGPGETTYAAPRVERPWREHVATTTDPDGSFCCAGLDPSADYVVAVRDSRMHWIGIVARPGDNAVRLVVERQVVAFAVRDESGEPLPGIRLHAEGYDAEAKHPVREPRPGFPMVGFVVGNPPLLADEQGRLCLLSPFGFVWRMAVRDECAEPDVLRHDAIPGVYRAERTMVLRAVADFGTLRIVALDEAGRPLADYGAVLRCLDRDLKQGDLISVLPPGGHSWELQAGRWHVAVHLGKLVRYRGFVAVRARGVQEHEVLIEPDRTTELRVVAEPKGVVAFRLLAEHPPAHGWSLQEIAIRTGGATIDLEHDSRRPVRGEPDLFAEENRTFYGRQALPPGRHAFVVTCKGFHPARCEVEVVADRLTTVDVELLAQ